MNRVIFGFFEILMFRFLVGLMWSISCILCYSVIPKYCFRSTEIRPQISIYILVNGDFTNFVLNAISRAPE